MTKLQRLLPAGRDLVALALRGLQQWSVRRISVALGAALAFGLLLGYVTVLIPNPVFARDIPPVWWNYPVWILTSVISGMLIATYVGTGRGASEEAADESRASRFGLVGGMLSWFAVGCPVCNKLALIALGYAGAITWFAPMQPFLAVLALVLSGVALLWRLRGEVVCVVPGRVASRASAAREERAEVR